MTRKLLAAALLLTCATGASAATVITFDDLSGSGLVADGYQSLKWGSNFSYYDSNQYPFVAHSPSTRIYSNYSIHNVGALDSLALVVGAGSVFDGAWYAGNGVGTVSISSYLGGVLKATSAAIGTSGTPTFLSSGYTGAVDKILFNGNNGYYVIDDLTFTRLVPAGSPTPEPATWLLMITGFGLVGSALRRRTPIAA